MKKILVTDPFTSSPNPPHKITRMIAFAVLRRGATRASPARLVAGISYFTRSLASKMSLNATSLGVRAFSGSAIRFGSGTSK